MGLKGVVSQVKKEMVLVSRSGLSLYMTLAPALMALVFLLVFGSMQRSSPRFAVVHDMPKEVVAKLEQVAELEWFASEDALRRRIEGPDALAGVLMYEGVATVLTEGNEGENFALAMHQLVSSALAAEIPAFTEEILPGNGGLAMQISRISVFLLALFVGGATLGLSAVDERETGVIRAFTVSPFGLWDYMLSKWLPALLIGALGVTAAAAVMGLWKELPLLLVLSVCGAGVGAFSIFILAGFAKNQIAAIGVMKLLMPLMLMVPISAFFVAERWQWLYYAFPMYWQSKALQSIFTGEPVTWFLMLSFLVSLPWAVGAAMIFRRQTMWKGWR